MKKLLLLGALLLSAPAYSHDEWADGTKVPDWVKSSCCGPSDAHLLRPDQVHEDANGYTVDGYTGPYPSSGPLAHIPLSAALPSQDGRYWIFYRDDIPNGGGQSGVYCFFVPMDF